MAGFLYFAPGAGVLSREQVARLGLNDVMGQASFGGGPIERGPNDSSGFLFALEHDLGRPHCRYDSEGQTWRNAGPYWFGYNNDARPMPEDLVRKDAIDTFRVRLSDGNYWALPAAQALPSFFGLDESGERVRKFKGRYRHLSKLGEQAFKAVSIVAPEVADESEEDAEGKELIVIARSILPEERQDEIAKAVLMLNYHIGPWELDALEMPDTVDSQQIIYALVDVMSMLTAFREGATSAHDEAKKKDGSGSG